MWRNAGLRLILATSAILLGGAGGFCGSASPDVVGAATGTDCFGVDAGPLLWINAPSYPLAVGTQATLSFETGSGSECFGYQVSCEPTSVLTVESLGDQAVSINAIDAGSATVQVFLEPDGALVGSLPLTVAAATAMAFGDESQLEAQIPGYTLLPPPPAKFDLIAGSDETVEAVLTDASGGQLYSQDLVTVSGGGVNVNPEPPEKFVVTALSGSTASFSGEITGQSVISPTYDIDIVSAAASATLKTRTDPDGGSVYALAVALDGNGNQVFGLGRWSFYVVGSEGSILPLGGDAAVKVTFTPGTAPGSNTLVADNGSLTAQVSLP